MNVINVNIFIFQFGGNDRILNIGFIFYLATACMGSFVSFVLSPLGIIPFLSFILKNFLTRCISMHHVHIFSMYSQYGRIFAKCHYYFTFFLINIRFCEEKASLETRNHKRNLKRLRILVIGKNLLFGGNVR